LACDQSIPARSLGIVGSGEIFLITNLFIDAIKDFPKEFLLTIATSFFAGYLFSGIVYEKKYEPAISQYSNDLFKLIKDANNAKGKDVFFIRTHNSELTR
jgi:hypothetical protein